MTELPVLVVTLGPTQIGTLTLLPGERTLFAFEEAYIEDAARPTLSLSFRDIYGGLITETDPTQRRVPPFFANLLPEGPLRDYLAARAGLHPQREFFLLEALGRDLPGAVEIRPLGEGAQSPEDGEAPPQIEERGFGFSLAGVQLKFSAVQRAKGGLTIPVGGIGGSWIVKLPSTSFSGVPENEFAMMELARQIGMDVPQTSLVPLSDIAGLPEGIARSGPSAFAIKRFDREDEGGAVHMEDFAQVFGLYPERKYERASYRNIAEVLWAETGETGITEFIRRFTFNALIGNGDMHLKNWSLIYPDGRTSALAPAYDFVSTVPYIENDKLALSFAGTKAFSELTEDRFERFAAKAALPRKLVLDTMAETVERFAAAWNENGAGLLQKDLHAAISKHLTTLPFFTRQR